MTSRDRPSDELDDGPDGPVDTLEPPHEPIVGTSSTAPTWALVLAGPVLALAHFWVVYLVSEASCAAGVYDEMSFVGTSTLSWFIVGATVTGVVLAAGAAATAGVAFRRGATPLTLVGAILSVGSAAVIAAVGLPILVLAPC